MIFYKKYQSIDSNLASNLPYKTIYIPYFEKLKDTEYEIVYNYALSIRNMKDKNDFYDIYKNYNVYKLTAKKHIKENYEKQIKYEIEELKAIYNIIEYFEYKLENI